VRPLRRQSVAKQPARPADVNRNRFYRKIRLRAQFLDAVLVARHAALPALGRDEFCRRMGGSKMKEWLQVLKAADAAARWHVHQRRKGPAQEPYINHLVEVAMLVANATDGTDTNLVTAALLHDAIEDCKVPQGTDCRKLWGGCCLACGRSHRRQKPLKRSKETGTGQDSADKKLTS
jgi:hypothetical protein